MNLNVAGSALGMVLVDPAEQRKGLGANITRQILSATQDNDITTVVLTSSHVAEHLYYKVGFEKIGSVGVYAAKGLSDQNAMHKVAEEIAAYYYDSCPVRIKILERLIDSNSPSVCVKDEGGSVEGFASSITRMSPNGEVSIAMGPILAKSSEGMGKLIDQFLKGSSGNITCFLLQDFVGEHIDTVTRRAKTIKQIESRGFVKTDTLPFMSYKGRQAGLFLNPNIAGPITLALS